MLKLFNRIKKISKLDKAGKDSFRWFGYMTEEVGEVARCLLEENGLKTVKASETSKQECCDILNSLFGLYISVGGTYEEMIEYANKKVDRWEKRQNGNKT